MALAELACGNWIADGSPAIHRRGRLSAIRPSGLERLGPHSNAGPLSRIPKLPVESRDRDFCPDRLLTSQGRGELERIIAAKRECPGQRLRARHYRLCHRDLRDVRPFGCERTLRLASAFRRDEFKTDRSRQRRRHFGATDKRCRHNVRRGRQFAGFLRTALRDVALETAALRGAWITRRASLSGCRRTNRVQEKSLHFCRLFEIYWSGREDSNLRPLGPEPSALPG
jgi:hypothetical protein